MGSDCSFTVESECSHTPERQQDSHQAVPGEWGSCWVNLGGQQGGGRFPPRPSPQPISSRLCFFYFADEDCENQVWLLTHVCWWLMSSQKK